MAATQRDEEENFVSLDATVARFEQAGVATIGIIAASEGDWDHYESLHSRAIEEWLAEHPDHTDAEEIRAEHYRFRSDYVHAGGSQSALGRMSSNSSGSTGTKPERR